MHPAVTIVMRSYNDAPLIGATIRAALDQDYPGPISILHIDSASKDGTVEVIQSFNPRKLIQLKPGTYVPGKVLNQGMRESTGDWVVYLNSDAQPADRTWLRELLTVARTNPRAGAVFGRQIPRPDCQAVYAHDYDRCFGPDRDSKHWDHFFSMVSSAVRRDVWEKMPFREDLQYSEDEEWTRRIRAAGWEVLFAERSVAIHSHNYTLAEAYKRCRGDLFAMAALKKDAKPRLRDWFTGVIPHTFADTARDFAWCRRNGRLHEVPHAFLVRLWQRLGKTAGHHAGWRHYHGSNRNQATPTAS